MTAISATTLDILQQRPRAIRTLIAPLLPDPPKAMVQQIGIGRDSYTLGALPNGHSADNFKNPEDALVATRVPGLLMNYYETWKQARQADEYFLERAYLHIHLATKPNPKQILSLHCDPALNASDQHFRYRRGPHMHVAGANPNIDRAHIGLCIGDQTFGGPDLTTLMSNFRQAVQMVRVEFFPNLERDARSV